MYTPYRAILEMARKFSANPEFLVKVNEISLSFDFAIFLCFHI